MSTNQTKTVVGVLANAVGSWTTKPTFKIRRATGGSWADMTGFGTTASPLNADGTVYAPTAVTLADTDYLGLWIVSAGTTSGTGPWSFRCRVRVDVAV